MRAAAVVLALVAAIAPAAAAHADQLGFDDVVAIAAEAFGPAAPVAARVARCESLLDTTAHNPGGFWPADGRWHSYDGLWQIDWSIHAWRVTAIYGGPRDVADPRVQAAVAAHIERDQGWGAWPVCSRLVMAA